jgi:hypothetical protein
LRYARRSIHLRNAGNQLFAGPFARPFARWKAFVGAENVLGGSVLLTNFESEALSFERTSKTRRYDNRESRRK